MKAIALTLPILLFLSSCLANEHVLGQKAVYSKIPQSPQYPSALTGGKNGKNYMHNYYLPRPGTGAPWWPSWSPDGQWIAFSLQGSIWKMKVGEYKAYEMVHSEQYLSSPEWSPDGRYIAYSGRRDNVFSIFRIDTKTMEENRVTPKSINAEGPTWSPDGSLIAFSGKKKGSGDWKIYYSLSSGGEYNRLTKTKSGIQETSPSWKP